MTQQLPKKICYEYQVDNTAKLKYTHGVWGGINPQGEIELNFYCENDKPPTMTERLVESDGSLGLERVSTDINQEEDSRTVIRNIHTKILVNYHTARALLEWLGEKIDTLEAEEIGSPFSLDLLETKREQ